MNYHIKKTIYKRAASVPFMKKNPLLKYQVLPQDSKKTNAESETSPPLVSPFGFSKKLQNPRMPRIQAISTPKKPKYRDLKIIFLVLNCKKNDYRRKKQTWLKALPSNFKFFHIQGDPDLPVLYKINENENLITLHCDDGYLGIPYKIMAAIKVRKKSD